MAIVFGSIFLTYLNDRLFPERMNEIRLKRNIMVISIDQAKYCGDYRIHLQFSDGTRQTIDFEEFLSNAKNPMNRKYLDVDKFKDFHLDHGDLVWGNYELCFPIWNLYEGHINK